MENILAKYIQFDRFGKAYLQIKVLPKQPKTEFVEQMSDGTLKIRIAAVPEKGKANEELIQYLSDVLGYPKKRFVIISGKSDPHKLLRIEEA